MAAAQAAFAVDEAHPIGELDAQLPRLLGDQPALWHTIGVDGYWDERLAAAINAVRALSRAGIRAPGEIRDLRQVLDGLRLVKDASELSLMQRAADIASLAHRRAMARTRPGLAEYQIEAELFHDFRLRGADGHSYPPIVAGGKNTCVLHYVENNAILKDGDLLLIDAGCEVAGYASDITRTYPVNGRFSAAQKDVYEIVLASQLAAIDVITPGATFQDPHAAALRGLTQGLVDLKLLSGDIDGLIESEAYKPWYMHRTGHWLGLDVHDAGDYKRPGEGGSSDWMPLEPGMVLTVEPGLYIRPADKVPEALWNIGIRIEDDVAVTATGCHVLTSPPKTVAEIEEVMAHG
jgi:Xaa-Pro aminopeptidase